MAEPGRKKLIVRFPGERRTLGIFILSCGLVVASLAIVFALIDVAASRADVTTVSALMTAVFVLSTALVILDFREISDGPMCVRCGYPFDQEVNPSQCSECGAELAAETAVSTSRPWRRSQRVSVFMLVVVLYLFWITMTFA